MKKVKTVTVPLIEIMRTFTLKMNMLKLSCYPEKACILSSLHPIFLLQFTKS
ncbi:hypothetical protein HanRHA438_Chr08g0348881 [Helianthus annuus]|uniref:Uncharacterized protein n=1 Tax=Helianthus annuus TaxID=4232 RepID=A0A9K3IE55_HELAN|nr:hypothetical protein HanXRQr2_Chr08g0337591 [Helianthus annuus]KAJ0546780.1 hypothetical protein HanIR_Chr08g0364731 [Helianthus annuus]KAJ0897729.1 hypothetical protein HanRHA438_Chr08g0348881 [Helianthus annuus]KAJ0901502.1 hypothetical protein HanPSC8_Chr08g0326031 [Helianthus annuus]